MTTETKHMPSEREIESVAEALARVPLTPKGKCECAWPDDWSRDERQMYRNQATAALIAASHSRAPDQSERVRELEAELSLANDAMQATALRAADEITALRASLAEVRKVIEPFAKVAACDIGCTETDDDSFRPMTGGHNHAPLLTVGDLRAARDWLTRLPAAGSVAAECRKLGPLQIAASKAWDHMSDVAPQIKNKFPRIAARLSSAATALMDAYVASKIIDEPAAATSQSTERDRALEEAAQIAIEISDEVQLGGYPNKEAEHYYEAGADDAGRVIADAIRAMKGSDGWRPIKTAPKDDTEILVSGLCEKERYISVGMKKPDGFYYKSWWDEGEENRLFAPTHWQPLPSPPDQQSQKRGG